MESPKKCSDRNDDVLLNNTYLCEKCVVCGRTLIDYAQDHFDVLWAVCHCGNVIECKNRMVQH